MKPPVPIIVGPTAIGKTAFSLLLAKIFPSEIVSADSRQIYKMMDIGTAKPETAELKQVKHHFIDLLDPSENFSSGQYSKLARKTISDILKCGNMPIVVGGSGFYIKTLVDGISVLELQDYDIRKSLQQRLVSADIEILYDELKQKDPELARRLKSNDKQRIIRGLEVYYTSGMKLSDLQKEKSVQAPFEPFFIGLTMKRSDLYERINKRVDRMFDMGLLEEVSKLKELGYHKGMNAMNTVGYKEVFSYLDNEISFDEMMRLIKRNSRRYAKRQYTWFNNDKRIRWFSLDTNSSLNEIVDKFKVMLQI